MSNPFMNAEHSPPQSSPSSPCLPDFIPLAEKLQEAAKALLAFAQSAASPESNAVDDTDSESATPEEPPYQIRSYQLPGFILEEEQTMLKAYKVDDWKELFGKVYEQLYTTAMLMQLVPAEEEIDGFSVQLMAGNLMMPLDMLDKLCSLIADFRLVREMKVE